MLRAVKSLFLGVLFTALWLLNQIVPKKGNLVLFGSRPAFSGNSRALFDYIRREFPQYECVWLVSDRAPATLDHNVRAYSLKSLAGLTAILRASYIFLTHIEPLTVFYVTRANRRQKVVLLWHGMPLKAMGFSDRTESEDNLRVIKMVSRRADLLVATSSVTKNALCASFFIDPRRVAVVGQPRNDLLFDRERQRRRLWDLLGVDPGRYRAVIMWLPTFRTGYAGRREGRSLLFALDERGLAALSRFLVANNCLLVVKPHVVEKDTLPTPAENIVVLTDAELSGLDMDLYHVLGGIDILITDYSSVYIDFLLLDRPIVFDVNDLGIYDEVRGFMLTPLSFWLPGPRVASVDELIKAIRLLLDDPSLYGEERRLVNDLLNEYKDDKSCERVCSLVFAPERR